VQPSKRAQVFNDPCGVLGTVLVLPQTFTCYTWKKRRLERSVVVLADVDDAFHPGMKETGVRVGASVERVRVQGPGLAWGEGLVENAIADRYDQGLEALGDRKGDCVA